MANITDLIMQQVKSAAGSVEIPANIQNTVLSGLSDSILGSLTQTASKAGGINQIKSLLAGSTSAASSPVTALAGNLFSSNVLSKLNLAPALSTSLKGLVPSVMGSMSKVFKDQDGDGDVDLNDILISLGGGKSSGSGLLGAASSLLGGFMKKK